MRYAIVLALIGVAFGQQCVPSSSQTCTANIGLANPNTNSQNWHVPLVQNNNWLDLLLSGNAGSITPNIPTLKNLTNLNNVLFVGGANTSDIGAQINAAYASLPANGGVIIYGPNATGTCYNTSTPITFTTQGKPVLLWQWGSSRVTAAGVVGTCINYIPTTATAAITLDYATLTDQNQPKSNGLRGVTLVNNNCTTPLGCGSSATGIAIGNVGQGAMDAVMEDVSLVGFGVGYSNNNILSPDIDWINPFAQSNTILWEHGTVQEKFSGGLIIGNGCAELAASNSTPELYFNNVQFTENTGGSCAAGFDFTNVGTSPAHIYFANSHLENSPGQSPHHIAGNVLVNMVSSVMEDDTSTGTGDWMVSLGTGQSMLSINASDINSARPFTNVFLMNSNSRATVFATNDAPGTLACNMFFGGADAANVNSLITPLGTANPLCTFSLQAGIKTPSVTLSNLLLSSTAPTISSGFGTSPSIVNSNGAAVFEVNVGTGGVATSGVIGLPTATNGWGCLVQDMSTNIVTRATAFTTTSVTLTGASAWTASDKLIVQCEAF